jgi:hypothetical protein
MAIDIGLIAFNAYRDGMNYISFSGDYIPEWKDVGQTEQNAWRVAAVAVLDYIDKEREDFEND